MAFALASLAHSSAPERLLEGREAARVIHVRLRVQEAPLQSPAFSEDPRGMSVIRGDYRLQPTAPPV